MSMPMPIPIPIPIPIPRPRPRSTTNKTTNITYNNLQRWWFLSISILVRWDLHVDHARRVLFILDIHSCIVAATRLRLEMPSTILLGLWGHTKLYWPSLGSVSDCSPWKPKVSSRMTWEPTNLSLYACGCGCECVRVFVCVCVCVCVCVYFIDHVHSQIEEKIWS